MAQWVKVSTLNPDNLSWTPHGDMWGAHVVEEENEYL